MPKLERLLFDLIETVSVDEHPENFAHALTEQIVRALAQPLRIAAAATLRLNGGRYEAEYTQGTPLGTSNDGQLSARTVLRRLNGQLWLVQRGIRTSTGAGAAGAEAAPAWFDLILIPIDRDLTMLLAVMTDSLAGEEGHERETAFQDLAQLLRLFVDRHHQRARLQEILTLADQQQLSLLPPSLPVIPGYRMAAVCVPAEEVGGDYYQAYPLTYAVGGFAIADAKGKGFEAAMQVTGLHAALRAVNETPFKLVHKVGMLNRSMIQTGELRNLISLFLAEWDAQGRLLYVNCSHPPPLWVRASSDVITELGEGGRFLGLDPKTQYRFGIAELQPGDTIVAYTDGWSELFNDRGEEFGPQRLRQVLDAHRNAPLETIMAELQHAADAFRGDLPFDDDRTLFLLRKE
jgi:serine phosphatase RsbU (regulator of sigma subunit)